MILHCNDGPLKDSTIDVRDDLKFGDVVQLPLPIDPIKVDEPIYHPFSPQARDRIVRKMSRYYYDGNALVECR